MDKETMVVLGVAAIGYYLYAQSQAQVPPLQVDPVAAAMAPYANLTVAQYNATAAKYPTLSPEQIAHIAAGFGPVPA